MNFHQNFLPYRTVPFRFSSHLFLLGLLLFLSSCGPSAEESETVELKSVEPMVEAIEPDTSLHRLNVREWNNAPEAKRKANCAGIIKTSMDSFVIRDSERFNQLSDELCACISQLTNGMPTMNDNAVFDEAKRCLASMGYREESDSLSLN